MRHLKTLANLMYRAPRASYAVLPFVLLACKLAYDAAVNSGEVTNLDRAILAAFVVVAVGAWVGSMRWPLVAVLFLAATSALTGGYYAVNVAGLNAVNVTPTVATGYFLLAVLGGLVILGGIGGGWPGIGLTAGVGLVAVIAAHLLAATSPALGLAVLVGAVVGAAALHYATRERPVAEVEPVEANGSVMVRGMVLARGKKDKAGLQYRFTIEAIDGGGHPDRFNCRMPISLARRPLKSDRIEFIARSRAERGHFRGRRQDYHYYLVSEITWLN